ncbi:hypothetical protein Mnod_5400 [Methylobacterium nodulans ORS 2060]|uniref:Uncharacterized protein n=2 Tax=Methylobacterium nodulans TaxID=114616 RepID=B8IMQ2_METNO|nr:hypothetical protein Mnod_5400 [Methylobacterium nodulans ORS 2060]
MAKVLEPSLRLQKQIESFLPRVPKFVADFQFAAERAIKISAPHIEAISKLTSNCKKLEAAGFLPHYTIPFDEVEKDQDVSDLGSFLEQFYRDNWSSIRDTVLKRVDGYDVDDEAKATFREAIQAHEQGLYRCVCRVLFPEIERISRVEIHAGSLQTITSQKELQKLAGELDTSQTEPRGMYALEFYGKLTEHLYEYVSTPAAATKAEQNSVSNRHATVHGVVSYSSLKNSLNALFMADYILQVVTVTKRQAKEDAEAKGDS